jgi:hypothetical protein
LLASLIGASLDLSKGTAARTTRETGSTDERKVSKELAKEQSKAFSSETPATTKARRGDPADPKRQ